MAMHLRPLNGPNKDQTFELKVGFTIGRSEGDLVLPRDSKLSSKHAVVEKDEAGGLFFVDQGSKNGLRIAGQQLTRVRLAPGIRITIGTFVYEITDQATPKRSKQKSKFWHEVLVDYAKRCLPHVENQPRAIVPFQPAVVLDFVRGIQAETRWILGFGPRKIGASSIDLPIYEPNAPAVCFEVLLTPDGVTFKTAHEDFVQLNGKSVGAEILRIADVIKINDTEIEVDFIE